VTMTSRGAVAPTAPSRPGGDPPAGAPIDTAALDAAVDHVADHAAEWAATPAAARADLLDQVLRDTMAAQDDWLRAACAAKGLEWGSPEAGEELFAGVGTLVRMARLYRDSLRQIARSGRPSFAGPVT
jgi:acyl-CoA reductase-like NAD-dependent aldehyde dehydrogenase